MAAEFVLKVVTQNARGLMKVIHLFLHAVTIYDHDYFR
jgi:hypothetical protein